MSCLSATAQLRRSGTVQSVGHPCCETFRHTTKCRALMLRKRSEPIHFQCCFVMPPCLSLSTFVNNCSVVSLPICKAVLSEAHLVLVARISALPAHLFPEWSSVWSWVPLPHPPSCFCDWSVFSLPTSQATPNSTAPAK